MVAHRTASELATRRRRPRERADGVMEEPASKRPRPDDAAAPSAPDAAGDEQIISFSTETGLKTFGVSLAALKQFPESLLCNLATTGMQGGARGHGDSILIGPPATEATLGRAIEECEWSHKNNLPANAFGSSVVVLSGQVSGPPIHSVLNPAELQAAWDFFGLPKAMIYTDRPRPGSSIGALAAQMSLDQEYALLPQLVWLANAISTSLPALQLPLSYDGDGEPVYRFPFHRSGCFSRELLEALQRPKVIERLATTFVADEAQRENCLALRAKPCSSEEFEAYRGGSYWGNSGTPWVRPASDLPYQPVCMANVPMTPFGAFAIHIPLTAFPTEKPRERTGSRWLASLSMGLSDGVSMTLVVKTTSHQDDDGECCFHAYVMKAQQCLAISWKEFSSCEERTTSDLPEEARPQALKHKTVWQAFSPKPGSLRTHSGETCPANSDFVAAADFSPEQEAVVSELPSLCTPLPPWSEWTPNGYRGGRRGESRMWQLGTHEASVSVYEIGDDDYDREARLLREFARDAAEGDEGAYLSFVFSVHKLPTEWQPGLVHAGEEESIDEPKLSGDERDACWIEIDARAGLPVE